jgi:UDP-glucuronate 4-epimerase
MSKAILITGANGFLGSSLVKRYYQTSETEIIAVWKSSNYRISSPPPHIHYVQCDLTDQLAVQELFKRWSVDRVFHAAALLPDEEADYLNRAMHSNIIATANLVECAANAGCKRFVFCSSISVYGSAPCPDTGWKEYSHLSPTSIYGWTKQAGEEILRIATSLSGLTGVSLRLAGIHGRGRNKGVIYNLMEAALDGKPINIDDSKNRFQLLFLDDAVELSMRALKFELQQPYRCFNTSSHVFPSIRHMAEQIVCLLGSTSQIVPSIKNMNKENIMNNQEIMEELLYTPKALTDCLDDFLKKAIS